MIDKIYTTFPVSGQNLSWRRTVDVILTSGKIPHEVTPVHPVHLVIEEECQILEEGRLLVIGSGHLCASITHI